jgi:hypothetical protein
VHRQNDNDVKAIAVSALDPDLLNACLRLVRFKCPNNIGYLVL